jgi:hypothetical protein
VFSAVGTGLWTVAVAVLLWRKGPEGPVSAVASWATVAAALLALHRAYDRRGMRATG